MYEPGDEADRAEATATLALEQALAAQHLRVVAQALALPAPVRDPDGRLICADCGALIQAGRLAVCKDATRCASCQAEDEQRAADEAARRRPIYPGVRRWV